MTDEERAMRSLTDARLRRNYDLTLQQISMAHAQGNARALAALQEYERKYLAEKVRRGVR